MAMIEARNVSLPDGRVVVVRPAAVDDVRGIIAHREHLAVTSEHNVTQLDEVNRDEARLREQVVKFQDQPGDLFLVVHEPGSALVLGDLQFKSVHDRRVVAHHGDFGLSVHAAWRGSGIGTVLIRTLLDWARAHPVIEKVGLGVYATNEKAIRLYKRMGFVEEGRREKFFKVGPGTYVDDILMAHWVKRPGS